MIFVFRAIAGLILASLLAISAEAKGHNNIGYGPYAKQKIEFPSDILLAQLSKDADVKQEQKLDPKLALQTAAQVRLTLDRAFYEFGDTINASVFFANADPEGDGLVVFAVSKTGDVELIILKKTEKGHYETVGSYAKLDIDSGKPTPHDGKLETLPGEAVRGVLFVDRKAMSVDVDVVADIAIVGTNADKLPKLIVDESAMSKDELAVLTSDYPFGVIATKGGTPVEVALGNILFTPYGLWDLESFLSYSGGKVIDGEPNGKADAKDGSDTTYLIQVPLATARDDRLPDLRNLYGDFSEAIAGQDSTFKTFALILEYRMKGYAVSANPRLRPHGRFSTTETDGNVLRPSMTRADRTNMPCQPTDTSCPLDVERLWAHMALWDLDTSEILVAFIDQGFATANPDFRLPASGAPLVECDLEAQPLFCAPGVANTLPTVGASLVGDLVWHGTGSVSIAGGVLNNGWTPGTGVTGGSAGTGGQVLVPMLFRMGYRSYAFEIGRAIRLAVAGRASCINIAAGFPCNATLAQSGSFDLCDTSLGDCSAIIMETGLLAGTAFAASCGAAGFLGGLIDAVLPGAGATLAVTTCSAAAAGAATAVGAVTTACTSLMALGDRRGPLQAGVDLAAASGVPIIASMGNIILPDEVADALRPFIDFGTHDGDALEVVPATMSSVIAVSAANSAGRAAWTNSEIRGRSVTVWAPEFNNYLAPPIGGPLPVSPMGFNRVALHGGTSSASSYVTGIVAAMQAADPTLNPLTPSLTPSNRAAIPGRIAVILRSTATEMGTGPEPTRLPMVNPYAALRRAWERTRSWPSGFDTMMNFDDDGTDDVVSGARALTSTATGTIISVPGTGGAPNRSDIDFYKVRLSSTRPFASSTFRVALSFPIRALGDSTDDLAILPVAGANPPDWTLIESQESSGATRIKTVTFQSSDVIGGISESLPFSVGGLGGRDNVYKLVVSEYPSLNPDRFDIDNSQNLSESRPDNNMRTRAVPIGGNRGLQWRTGNSVGPLRTSVLGPLSLNFHTATDEDWFVFRLLPSGPGSGRPDGCVSALEIEWNANVRYESALANSPDVLLGRERDRQVVRIVNPQNGLMLKFTPSTSALSTDYVLNVTFIPAPGGPPCQ
jgi:Subtilase family